MSEPQRQYKYDPTIDISGKLVPHSKRFSEVIPRSMNKLREWNERRIESKQRYSDWQEWVVEKDIISNMCTAMHMGLHEAFKYPYGYLPEHLYSMSSDETPSTLGFIVHPFSEELRNRQNTSERHLTSRDIQESLEKMITSYVDISRSEVLANAGIQIFQSIDTDTNVYALSFLNKASQLTFGAIFNNSHKAFAPGNYQIFTIDSHKYEDDRRKFLRDGALTTASRIGETLENHFMQTLESVSPNVAQILKNCGIEHGYTSQDTNFTVYLKNGGAKEYLQVAIKGSSNNNSI